MKKIFSLLTAAALVFGGIPAYADDAFTAAEGYVEELTRLIGECEIRGMDVSYERADCEIIKDFITYGRQDIEWGDTERAGYVSGCLEDLYQENKTQLSGYLNGTKKPKAVVRNYASDYAGAQQGDFLAKDGRPLIFNGYGVFDMLKNDIDRLQEFGADIAQIEIGPNAVLSRIGSVNGWSSNLYGGASASASLAQEDGSSVMKITNSSQTGYLALTQSVSVRPNTTYTLSMRIKTVSGGGGFFSAQGWTGARANIAQSTNDWRDYSVEYTTADGEYNAEILLVSNRSAGAIYIDDVRLCAQGGSENLVQNGDFESNDVQVSEHFQANTAPIRGRVTRVLDNAYKNGVMVNVLISPHYFPSWILKEYPELTGIDCGLGYDINNPVAQEALELYIKTLMQEIGTHPALHSVCISNEPSVDTRKSAALNDKYAEYLSGVYNGDISALNKVYSTSYSSFSEVKMPASDSLGAAYYDWVQFNDSYGAAWNRYLAQTVKKYAPGVPVHAKIMTIFGKSNSLSFGINPEDFAEFCDFNGNDAWGFYGQTASGLLSKLMWYDLLGSIKPDAPIINSEDHITEDGNENYTEKQAVHIAADIWQGAVHGRDASIIWIWNRTQDKNAATYGNILYRPDVLSAVSEKSLDINRLSGQLAALQKSESGISILYSPTTRAYRPAAVNVLKLAYEAGLYTGAKPGFVTERQLAQGVQPKGTLIVPMATNVSDAAYAAVAAFKKGGGRVIAIGTDSLLYDEHNQKRSRSFDFDTVFEVRLSGNSVTSPQVSAVADAVGGESGVYNVNGEPVRGVEKITAEYNGKTLWNLCNYAWSGAAEVAIPSKAEDLLTGRVYSDYVTLNPFEPVLLEFCTPELSAEAYVRENNGWHTISVRVINSGKAETFADITALVTDGAGNAYEKADARRYIAGSSSAGFEYTLALPEAANSVKITVRYGKNKTAPLEIKFR